MSLCLVLMFVYHLLSKKAAVLADAFHVVFWLEAVAIVAFGISWLTKGEAILKDDV